MLSIVYLVFIYIGTELCDLIWTFQYQNCTQWTLAHLLISSSCQPPSTAKYHKTATNWMPVVNAIQDAIQENAK